MNGQTLGQFSRIIIKVGSALLADDKGQVRRHWLAGLAHDIAKLRANGQQVLIVTSGSIALGRRQMGLRKAILRLDEKQAAAAIGQPLLMEAWQQALASHDLSVAQILLTLHDTEARQRHINARQAMLTLLDNGYIPIINENDTVATAEIRYGDNDRLAARVASMVSADCLVLLSDIDGLYDSNPRTNPNARHIPLISQITPEIEAMAGGAASPESSGGMVTKLIAARIAQQGGCTMVICRGNLDRPLTKLEEGGLASWFTAKASPQAARKRWLLGSLKPAGQIMIDSGAVQALRRGKSLLPSGVTEVQGNFSHGEPVLILSEANRVPLAIGLIAYSDSEARQIQGRKSDEITGLLGYQRSAVLIHRDDLAMMNE